MEKIYKKEVDSVVCGRHEDETEDRTKLQEALDILSRWTKTWGDAV
jgi:hypothetical protein